jgi:uncharacterized repeat protein (TIGR01451 family)
MSAHVRRTKSFRAILGALVPVVLIGAMLPAQAASAATVYQIAGQWADGSPTSVNSGDVVTAEWRINVNDDAPAPDNEPVDNVTLTVQLESGRFDRLPDLCLVDGVDPASSISADGSTLICNVGTRDEGTAVALQTGIIADGATGEQLSAVGSIGDQTAALPPIDITNVFSMDTRWTTATGTKIGPGGQAGTYDFDMEWTLFQQRGSDAGPQSVTYNITSSTSTGNPLSVSPNGGSMSIVNGCTPFTTGNADGHPWSGGSHPAERTAPYVGSCTLVATGPNTFQLTITGIDYSKSLNPTADSSGRALPGDQLAVASGSIWFRVNVPVTTGVRIDVSSPTYTSVSGATSVDDPANNAEGKNLILTGDWASTWNRGNTGSGGTPWDDTYRVSPGTSVQNYVQDGFGNSNLPGNTPLGACTVIDSRYSTFDYYTSLPAIPSAVVEYYTGGAAVVDPNSAQYNPNAFDCNTGGANVGGTGWTTTQPADKTTIKAVRIQYLASAAPVTPDVGQVFYVNEIIKPTTPAGTDVWTWHSLRRGATWENPLRDTNGAGAITPTPGARYPYTTGARDILRVITATPSIAKSADRSVVTPGVPATYTLTYAANGAGAIPPTVDGFTMVDTLPVGVTYVPGSANPEPVVTTNGTGQQVLTWTLNGVTTNAQHALTYQAVASADVQPGQSLRNTVTASYAGQTRSAAANVVVAIGGYTTIAKTADAPFIPNTQGDGIGDGSWTVLMRSFDPLPQDFTDTIDVLPYVGDDRGTAFSGTYELTEVEAATGATVYYTTADPATLSDDPGDASNGVPGDPTGNTVGWTTTYTPDATAVRVIGGELAPAATQAFTVRIATDGAQGGDVFVNVAQARAEHTELVMRTSDQVSVANFYSASLKKYVQNADGEWVDANTAEDYPTYQPGDTVPYRIVITNTGQGTLTDLVITDDLFPEGSFTVDELAPGAEEVHEFEVVLEAGGLDTVVNTACGSAAIPGDSGVPPTINCDPAGIEVEGEPTHTKEIVSAAPIGGGQWQIVYALTVANTSTASTSYSLADELHFTDEVEITSAAVTASPDGVTLADPVWDGQTNLTLASNVALPGSDDAGYAPHVYKVTVVADVPLSFEPGGTPPATECAADGEDTDTAFNNTSALTLPNGEIEPDQACAAPPSIDIAKSVSAGPTANGDGTWTVTYDVVATNDGGAEGVYDVSDRMTADGDLEVVSGSVISAPEGVTPSAGWTGLGAEGSAENVIATNVPLAAGSTHTYQVRVVIGLAEGTEGAPAITPCSADPGAGGGLSNTAEIEHNDLTDDASACITVGVVTVDKSVSSGPTPNGDGTWTVVYDIVATQVGGADADYDVTDRLHFGEGIEIVDAAVITAPDGVDTNTGWTGLGAADSHAENVVAENVTLPVGETHTYQVEVTVQMDEATIDPGSLECAPPGSGDAGGLGNSTTLASNGIVGQDDVCPSLPLIELDKSIVEGSPIENGDGTWTILYDVTATNTGQAAGDYNVSDQLQYGAGLEVVSSEITASPEGVELNAGWTGLGAEADDAENTIASGVTLAAGATHTYRVAVVASMDRAVVTPGDLECPAPGSGESGGFANTAGLTHNGEDQADDACVTPPLIEITKSLSGAVAPVDGQPGVYDATYEITVSNSSPGAGIYDLDDELAPGEGVTVVGIQGVTSDAPAPVAINAGFDGLTDRRIVTDQPIAGAAGSPVVHTYTVTVRYSTDLAGIDVPDGDVCTTPGGDPLPGTLNNTATAGWNGLEDADDECVIPGKPTLDKAIVSATPVGKGQWEVVYDLTVGNTGTEATTYDLDDELLFAPQITVDSVSVDAPEGVETNAGFDGDSDQRIATDVAIIGLDDDGYAPHVYRVTVLANVPLQFDEGDIDGDGTGSPACTAPTGDNFIEQGLNNAATLTDETGGTIVDTDCAGVPSIDIAKAMDGAPVKGANGHWTVNYTITVQNDGAAAGQYTLTDQLRYGAGITVLSADVATAPDGVVPASTWTGLGEQGASENIVASDVALAVGSVHSYRVVVEAQLDTSAANSTTLVCPAAASDERGGFANTAGISHNDLVDDASACALPEWPQNIPSPLANTGNSLVFGVLGGSLLLLLAGGVLLYLRRRNAAAGSDDVTV